MTAIFINGTHVHGIVQKHIVNVQTNLCNGYAWLNWEELGRKYPDMLVKRFCLHEVVCRILSRLEEYELRRYEGSSYRYTYTYTKKNK